MGAFAQAIGPVPEWLELGPVTQVDGRSVREILGDWPERPEGDRPPKYLVEGEPHKPHRSPLDKSEAREAIEQRLPGRSILELKGIHSGRVAILFNGESMARHDIWKIKKAGVPIIGMNRTHVGYPGYKGPQPDYLCIVDTEWFQRAEWREAVRTHPGVINGSVHKEPLGFRVTRHPRMAPFSFDLHRDGYVAPIPCTTGHLALQAAVYMGFTELYCLGLDLGGNHFDGTPGSRSYGLAYSYHKRQAPLLKEKGVSLYLVEAPESRLANVFPQASFGDVCG